MSIGIYESNFDGEGLRIGIVQARFNEDILPWLARSMPG